MEGRSRSVRARSSARVIGGRSCIRISINASTERSTGGSSGVAGRPPGRGCDKQAGSAMGVLLDTSVAWGRAHHRTRVVMVQPSGAARLRRCRRVCAGRRQEQGEVCMGWRGSGGKERASSKAGGWGRTQVANRACVPSSKRYCHEQWLAEDVRIEGCESLELHHLYRAMDFLEAHREALEEGLYFRVADLLNLDVEVVFCDTTSLHFEVDEEDTGVGEDDEVRGSRAAGGEDLSRPAQARQVEERARGWAASARRARGHARRLSGAALGVSGQHRVPRLIRTWESAGAPLRRRSGVPRSVRLHAGKKLLSRIATHQPLAHLGQALRVRDAGQHPRQPVGGVRPEP